jgi:class 3 adenylate cyclase/tetratricopeptide (TPR) repeat protein
MVSPNLNCPAGHENPATAKFCAECGRPLATARSEPAERRFVSVLFADLVGFTSFSESRDPEETREMLTRYFSRAREIIERFGGEVDKYIGDAVAAFWGTRVAKEDDAERAVSAALELVAAGPQVAAEIGVPELALRAAVLTGPTAVGPGGNQTGMVVGDIVNTAARLQAAAKPGTVVVGDTTKDLTEGRIHYEELGEHQLKGKKTPVRAWRVLGVSLERSRSRLVAPFVDREDELRLLKDQVHATGRERSARLVSIVGEAGIGKSRLASELRDCLEDLTEPLLWHQGRSPAYGDGVTFWALGEMVRQWAAIAESDEPLRARNKLRTAVTEEFTASDERRWVEGRLAALLGLDEMPAGDRDELFGALRALFHRIADRVTTLMVFEDLHWADSGLRDFIEDLVDKSPSHPILVITLARPELSEQVPTWGSSSPSHITLHLGPLADSDVAKLVEGLAPGIPPETVSLVVSQAAGVPLYGVEYVRMLIAGGDLVTEGDEFRILGDVSHLAVPIGLQALVGARLDRLNPTERRLIQQAAVLGQSFATRGLAVLSGLDEATLEARLGDLTRREILRYNSDQRSPERGQYQFVQSVIREVAYGRLSRQERRQRHLQAAEYFEEVAGDAAVVANHYLSAFNIEPDPAIGERARAALLVAARRAMDLHSYAQVIALCEQALAVPGNRQDEASLVELVVTAASAVFRHELALEYADRLVRLATNPTEQLSAALVHGRALVEWSRPGDGAVVIAPFYEPGRLAEPAMRNLGAELARAYMLNNENERSAGVAAEVIVAAEVNRDLPVLIEALTTRGTSLANLRGRAHEGIALLREALRLSEQSDNPYSAMRALNNVLVIEDTNGITAVRDGTVRGLELAKRLGRFDFLSRMTTAHSEVLREDGSFEESSDALEVVGLKKGSHWHTYKQADKAVLRWILTGDPQALTTAMEQYEQVALSEEPQVRWFANAAMAEVELYRGRYEAAFDSGMSSSSFQVGYRGVSSAVEAAIRLGDTERLARAGEELEGAFGRRPAVVLRMAEAGATALTGEPGEAARLFEVVADEMERVEGQLSAARARALYALTMPDWPGAADAAQAAYGWFTAKGATGFLALYADAWQGRSVAATA